MIDILVGGDVYPAGSIQEAFIDGNAAAIFGDLLEEIAGAELSIVNLECPMISREAAILKTGPALGVPTQCVQGLAASKVKVLNLANNHSMDHGREGLRETLDIARGAGLEITGAGMNLKEARLPLVKSIRGHRIVILAMAEHEFSIADQATPGANPLDLINFVQAVQSYKEGGTFIVLIHGGAEFYPYPSPELIRRCRFMVDMGADAVVCCHTHCPLPWEYYAGRPIIYGLGNLIFEAPLGRSGSWHSGYLAKLTITDEGISFKPIPYFQSRGGIGAHTMEPESQRSFLEDLRAKGRRLQDDDFIRAQWSRYCRSQASSYLAGLFGYNRVMRKMRSLLLRTLHSRKDVLRALHLVRCESHQEVLNTIFEDFTQGTSDLLG